MGTRPDSIFRSGTEVVVLGAREDVHVVTARDVGIPWVGTTPVLLLDPDAFRVDADSTPHRVVTDVLPAAAGSPGIEALDIRIVASCRSPVRPPALVSPRAPAA